MLNTKQLSHSFVVKDERFDVLKDINITANEREFVCILGPSGCGKTILLYLIAGFLEPTSGNINLDNKQITKPGQDRTMDDDTTRDRIQLINMEECPDPR